MNHYKATDLFGEAWKSIQLMNGQKIYYLLWGTLLTLLSGLLFLLLTSFTFLFSLLLPVLEIILFVDFPT